MRVAVVDLGTNSTRLLVADVDGGAPTEVDRRSIVTRLGEGVDATGRLGDSPQQRVFAVLEGYAEAIDAHGCERNATVMTSAVRDADNGQAFAAAVRERYGLEGRTLTGDEEAALSFRGATTGRGASDDGSLLVVDVGGGSTELVVGIGHVMSFHVSTQAGAVRHSERHVDSDPPAPAQLEALAADVRDVIAAAVPAGVRDDVGSAVSVAGTATSCAAMDLELEPYDAAQVEGHRLLETVLEAQLARLGAMTFDERRAVTGLDPARAPTIVAGAIILLEVLRAFGLDGTSVSERDILWGVALDLAG